MPRSGDGQSHTRKSSRISSIYKGQPGSDLSRSSSECLQRKTYRQEGGTPHHEGSANPPTRSATSSPQVFSITLSAFRKWAAGATQKPDWLHLPATARRFPSPHRVDCGCSETGRRPAARPDRQNGLPARLGARPVAGRSWLVLTWAEAGVSFYPHLSLQHRKPAARGSRWALKENKPGSGGIRVDQARDQLPRGKKRGVAEVAE